MYAQKGASVKSIEHNASYMESGKPASVVNSVTQGVVYDVRVKALEIKMRDVAGYKYSINIEPVGETIHDYNEKIMAALQDVSDLINELSEQGLLKSLEEREIGVGSNFRASTTGTVREAPHDFRKLVLKLETSGGAGKIVADWNPGVMGDGYKRVGAISHLLDIEFVPTVGRDAAMIGGDELYITRRDNPSFAQSIRGLNAMTAEFVRAVINTGAAGAVGNLALRGMLKSNVFDSAEKEYLTLMVMESDRVSFISKREFAYEVARDSDIDINLVFKGILDSDSKTLTGAEQWKVELLHAMFQGYTKRTENKLPGKMLNWISWVMESNKLEPGTKADAVTGVWKRPLA